MSDIYYCSNGKNSRKNSANLSNSMRTNNSSKNIQTSAINPHAMINGSRSVNRQDNDRLCEKHRNTPINKTIWNAKGLNNSTSCYDASSMNDCKTSSNSNVFNQTMTTATVVETSRSNIATNHTSEREFHNTRCTRHHHAEHSHGLNISESLDNNVSNSNYDGLEYSHNHDSHNHNHSHKNHSHHMQRGRHKNISNDISNCNNNNHNNHNHNHIHHMHKSNHRRNTESILSTDSDLRFTRRKLGDSQKCGCCLIVGFLISLLIAGIFVYIGYTYFKPQPLPDHLFHGKFRVNNEKWLKDLADQKTERFQLKARDYRHRINALIRHSDLKEAFRSTEILALDGYEDTNDLIVHFNMVFDPYAGLVTTSDLLALFSEEFNQPQNSKYFTNITIDLNSLTIMKVISVMEESTTSSASLGRDDDIKLTISTTSKPLRRCENLKLTYCRTIGYNITTYPNLLGHNSYEETEADVIAFRELVDAECFREAFDFICRLLQPPCNLPSQYQFSSIHICREYCEEFMKGCGKRLPKKFLRYFDCELFPEAAGIQSCHHKPRCVKDLQMHAQSPRLCDGYADCPDLSDEKTCSFCNSNSLYCGRGRACIPRNARCDGKPDCPDGSDEKDCLSIAPSTIDLIQPNALVPYLPRFFKEGFAVFSERGEVGKLCAEGLEGENKLIVRQTVAESLCKSLGYESVQIYDVQNDTEIISDYVRVLDPNTPEISFVRTRCPKREVLFVECGPLQCGVQSVLNGKQYLTLPKMAAAGDWPWLTALFREDIHVCDGTLISHDWVLTTESCFQGQSRATWMAIFGSVRLATKAPWSQRRRIIGMIKSPVEGSTAALVRLEFPVVFSDHVRPICLPDVLEHKHNQIQRHTFIAKPTSISKNSADSAPNKRAYHEMHEYFISPIFPQSESLIDAKMMHESNSDNSQPLTLAEIHENMNLTTRYPVVDMAQSFYYLDKKSEEIKTNISRVDKHIWSNCNTLGWSRQRDHLQRVQLKIENMAACENISIATVNSMCTEATFQRHDCTQEEYAGAPVQCLIPNTNQWALVGISSWRIACGPSGVERPRMYDKITSNVAWIRENINDS